MCLMLYLASTAPLPAAGSPDAPGPFHARPLNTTEHANLRAELRMPYAACLGSATGCGCGFQSHPRRDEPSDPDVLESLQALAEYLRSAAAQSNLVLLVTWCGKLTGTPKRHPVSADFCDLLARAIPLRENSLYEIPRAC